jgi:hypothetical protein
MYVFSSFPRAGVTVIKLSVVFPLLTKEGVRGW